LAVRLSVHDAEQDEIGWGRVSGAKRQACRKERRGFVTEKDPLTPETKNECWDGMGLSPADRLHHHLHCHLLQYFTIIISRIARSMWRGMSVCVVCGNSWLLAPS